MHELLTQLRQAYPTLRFTSGSTFSWSPETQEVIYARSRADSVTATWSLLHETGHALLGHNRYGADIELLKLEVAAWQKARLLAADFAIEIDEDHIQACLDTYRDWLHARSVCPTCTTLSFQQTDISRYRCHNCHTGWQVTPARFARPYRTRTAPSAHII